ncbi:MAG: hypothetical protein L3K06_07085 [Thermoplasmata archaeon]|nr:hypothetical protein [Thermoplasmata archaeon]
MGSVLYSPDRAIVRAIKAIDPAFSVVWDEDRERWVVYHQLQLPDDPEGTVAALARETARDFRDQGQVVPYHACLLAAYRLVDTERLVAICAEPDGTFRPLDGRLVAKLRRMAWLRRTFEVRDWLSLARAQQDQLAAEKRRAADTIWDSIRTDRVFHRLAVPLLRGDRKSRAVHVRQEAA